MEIANRVAKEEPDVGTPPVPAQVRRSSLPNPEETRGKSGSKGNFRKVVEARKSEVKEEIKEKAEEKVFSRSDEPVVKGTIVITIYENHPYDTEFSGDISGEERNLAWRAMMKGYNIWKAKVRKEQEKQIKAAEAAKKEEEDARN